MSDQLTANARLQAAARDHLLLHFGQHANLRNGQEVFLPDRGEGVYLHDAAGKRYIDGLSALFCAQLGYSYGPEFAKTGEQQLNRLPFSTLWNTAHPAAIKLAERLATLAPDGINRVFFTSGGSESVESAWKLARMYHVAQGQPQRTKAIARRTAYHGQTMGALALTGIPALKEPFGAPGLDVTHVPQHQPGPHHRQRRGRLHLPAAGRDRGGGAGGRPGERGPADRRTRAERRRLLHAPGRLLGGAAGDGRQIRLPPGRRRGHHRLRPDRRVLRGVQVRCRT
jgi:adenosylmethionine-8-amino-7-oxononanoate aminotransferase